MTRYNAFNIRHSIAALVCTVLFSTTCLVAAVGPARAAPVKTDCACTVVVPLA